MERVLDFSDDKTRLQEAVLRSIAGNITEMKSVWRLAPGRPIPAWASPLGIVGTFHFDVSCVMAMKRGPHALLDQTWILSRFDPTKQSGVGAVRLRMCGATKTISLSKAYLINLIRLPLPCLLLGAPCLRSFFALTSHQVISELYAVLASSHPLSNYSNKWSNVRSACLNVR